MQALTLQVNGRAYGGQAAALPQDFTRLGEMQTQFSGTAPLHHTHVSADISDFSATVVAILAAQGITGGAPIVLQPNGGLASGVQGLYVDSGIVSWVGHTHRAADIVDFQAALIVGLAPAIFDSHEIYWNRTASGVQAFLRLNPAGALTADNNGLAVNLGTSHSQAAFGDHTHAQLHNPVTFEPSSSLAITLAGQDIDLEVQLAPLSGLLITPSGLAVDFGTGHNQVLRGDTATGGGAGALNVVTTTSLSLLYDSGTNTLSGIVRLDGNPSSGRGFIGVGGAGLFVQLGTDAQSAAAGNHIHTNANSGIDGFMAAADYRLLHSLAVTVPGGVTPVLFTRETSLMQGGYLLGQYFWDVAMTVLDAQLNCIAPQTTTVLTLEVNGALTAATLTIAAAAEGTAVAVSGSVNIVIPAGQRARWKVTTGSTIGTDAATECGLVMRVEAS